LKAAGFRARTGSNPVADDSRYFFPQLRDFFVYLHIHIYIPLPEAKISRGPLSPGSTSYPLDRPLTQIGLSTRAIRTTGEKLWSTPPPAKQPPSPPYFTYLALAPRHRVLVTFTVFEWRIGT
jgi:hypothetical protein